MNNLSRVISDGEMNKILLQFDRLHGKCYLDNSGAAMYPKSQMHLINNDLLNNLYMNPHSDRFTADCIDQIRYTILRHFNTDSATYSVVFTANTTSALKLVAETFNFNNNKRDHSRKQGAFVYALDNHTSVLGMRDVAFEKKADVIYIKHSEILEVSNHSTYPEQEDYKVPENALFVYSAQNNFNGFKYPLNCVGKAKKGYLNKYTFERAGKRYDNWFVILDSAGYASTNKLDLSKCQPDFMCMSFYKLFGFPTGLGALLIKNDSAEILSQKTYYGGGTVDVVLSEENFHVKRKNIQERFEDGTASFLSIISLKHCFDTLNNLIPKSIKDDVMETISYHTFHLAKDLYMQLKNLKHPNGLPATVLYSDSDYEDVSKQGAIVAFNLLRPDGRYIGYAEIQHMANLFNICLRTGCFCNTGSCQRHLRQSSEELKDMYKAGHICGDEVDLFLGKPTGCVRVSFGYYNTYKDVDELMAMICKCFVQTSVEKPDRSFIANGLHNGFKNGNGKRKDFTFIKNDEIVYRPYNRGISSEIHNANLEQIAIFPIKSCGAYKINTSWKIGEKGFEYDREWMIIRDNGTCLTQKQCTRMCMIRPIFNFRKRLLVLSYPGMPSISVPLDMNNTSGGRQSSFCQSKVCNDNIQGYDCGEKIGDWISEALEISFLRLIKQCDDKKRVQRSKVSDSEEKKQISFSNQAQYLLINKATVRWLATKIEDETFDKDLVGFVDRFRGNIIVDAGQELVEREWTRVVIGNHEFKVEGPCLRCQMVCIDQNTGMKTAEPLRTISESFAGKLRFGVYLSYVGNLNGSGNNIVKCQESIEAMVDSDISR